MAVFYGKTAWPRPCKEKLKVVKLKWVRLGCSTCHCQGQASTMGSTCHRPPKQSRKNLKKSENVWWNDQSCHLHLISAKTSPLLWHKWHETETVSPTLCKSDIVNPHSWETLVFLPLDDFLGFFVIYYFQDPTSGAKMARPSRPDKLFSPYITIFYCCICSIGATSGVTHGCLSANFLAHNIFDLRNRLSRRFRSELARSLLYLENEIGPN